MSHSENTSPRYTRNPDVALREEEEDGALLFNPDTDQIRVLNATGLLIWKACDGTCNLSTLVANIKDSFEGVPEAEVDKQVADFVNEMVTSGFISVVEP